MGFQVVIENAENLSSPRFCRIRENETYRVYHILLTTDFWCLSVLALAKLQTVSPFAHRV